MPPIKMRRQHVVGIPMTLALMGLPFAGCAKAEEMADKLAGKESTEKDAKEGDEKKGEGDAKESGAEGGGGKDEVAKVEPEPIPVEPLLSGVDLMLSFVPDPESEYMIVRDASVLAEYYEETVRFLDTPVQQISRGEGLPKDVQDLQMGFDLFRLKGKEVIEALASSGLNLKEGGAVIKNSKGKSILVFSAADPGAVASVAKALGENGIEAGDCKALEGFAGWNACADDKATLDSYAPAADPKPVRDALAAQLDGIDLEEANLLLNGKDGSKPIIAAVTTLPGLVHFAVRFSTPDTEAQQAFAALEPGEAHTLANVQPGAGFIWARTKPELTTKKLTSEMGSGVPPSVRSAVESFDGEWLVAGSLRPGGLIFQAGVKDASTFGPLWDALMAESASVPKEIPQLPGSTVLLEKSSVTNDGKSADALHVQLGGIKEADIVKAFSGIHFDGWAFASGNALTLALGPDSAGVGKLLTDIGDGVSPDTLSSLPGPLADAFRKNNVSLAIHMPMDWMQGHHMHRLVEAALKDVPEVKPELVLALASTLAPISSASVWFEGSHEDGDIVMHAAVVGVGNRATDEGKAALDAAHAVTEGTSPEAAFGPMASKYGNSGMAFAYTTRAGSEGPGSLVGSGVGGLFVAGAVTYAAMTGAANASLADDLGVKAEDPEPEVEIKTAPVAPVHEPKKEDPKPPADPKPPKEDPEPADDPPAKKGKADPETPTKTKGDAPIVEPDRPKPPVPQPDDPAPAGGKKGKKKKKKKKKK